MWRKVWFKRYVGIIVEGSVEEGGIWGRGGGNIFLFVIMYDIFVLYMVV